MVGAKLDLPVQRPTHEIQEEAINRVGYRDSSESSKEYPADALDLSE